MSNPLVSVVIPNWNGKHHLEACLPSLFAQTYRPFEVIVVDNGSTDGSVEWLATAWPQVRVVAFPQNRGVVAAFNAGVQAARGELIALLNNDTEQEPDWLERFVAGLLRHSDAGMAACKIRLWDDRTRLHTAGDTMSRDAQPGNRGVWEPDDGRFDREEYVFAPCGAAALYRRALFEDVGLFDQRLGSYLEDVDLAFRAQWRGWRCIYVPDAVVYHKVSATGGGVFASYYVGRNWFYVITKNFPARTLRRHWRAIARAQAQHMWEAVRAWRGAAARARLRGMLVGALTWPRFVPDRRRIQATARVREEEIEALFS